MRNSCLVAIAAAGLILPLGACDDDDPLSPDDDPAMVRIVNAAEGTADLAVMRSGSATAIATLDFAQTTTTCVEVPAGERTFTFESGDDEIASATANLEEGDSYLLVLASPGAGEARRAVIASTEHAVDVGFNGLFFINASATTGDVYVTAPDAEPAEASLVSDNLSPFATGDQTLSEPFERLAAHTRVRLFDDGETTDPRADILLSGLPASRLATVVFTDEGADPEDRAFLSFPCP